MKLLCVEDDYHVTDGLKTLCEYQGIECDTAPDGSIGMKLALERDYDIIVLDIMLPKIDGFEVLRQLRARDIRTPVLMLTARGTTEDKVRSLEIGADDYMVKPIMASEFFARIRAIIRRHEQEFDIGRDQQASFKLGNLEFFPFLNSVKINDKEIRLTQKEARILETLIRRPGKVVSRDELVNYVWGYENGNGKSGLEIYIYKLRKKIKDANAKINTVRKIGYVLE